MKSYLSETIPKSFDFANYLATSIQKSFYVVIGEAEGQSAFSQAGWAGVPSTNSRGPYFANCKAGELLLLNKNEGLSVTPIPNFKDGHGWKGGVRYGCNYVAVSALSEEHDQLIAAVILYHDIFYKLKLHHTGYWCTKEEYENITSSCPNGYTRDVADHFRTFFLESGSSFEYGKSYKEYFYYLEDYQNDIHFDFVVDNIEHFLGFLSDVTGIEPEYWPDAKENSPKAGLFVTDKKGLTIGVMCRNKFWDVEND